MGGVGEGDNYNQNTLYDILKELIFKIAYGGFYVSFFKMLPINAIIFKMETSGISEEPFTVCPGMRRKLVARLVALKMQANCVIRNPVHQEDKT